MCMLAQSLSHVQLLVTPWTIAHQAPLSMRFPPQEYCNGLPFPRIFPDQGSNLCLLHWQVDSLPLSPQGSPAPVLISPEPQRRQNSHMGLKPEQGLASWVRGNAGAEREEVRRMGGSGGGWGRDRNILHCNWRQRLQAPTYMSKLIMYTLEICVSLPVSYTSIFQM